LRHALWLVARQAGMTALAEKFADMLRHEAAPPADDPNFPVPRLAPQFGFLVDPALVYGITLMESSFDPTSLSSAGARGLMQLMPMTAVEVAGEPTLADVTIDRLYEPEFNLDLGQRFLLRLATMPGVGGDMMRLLASYYSGPTAVAHWAPPPADGADPFLFLETIPADDVRGYVRRGLKYTWVYAARFRLRPPGLDDLAADRWPRFAPLPARTDFLPPHLRP
jgi:soluble lytic murein transglycosylase-like protein